MDLMRRTGRELRAVFRAETPTHRRYRDHLTVIVVATIGVDLVCTVLAYFLERHAAGAAGGPPLGPTKTTSLNSSRPLGVGGGGRR